ncbi:hypothetical protein AQ773_08345 [Burkholderia pseudomallei]|nr:hypothetical protein UQ47_06940 [Burkholderia pseudomallei]OMQ51080.1 hypothetical protein AQ708_09260 [Burkholderia pseudomallei]OMS19240.1 hypothetical protein AQ738_17965 [Burkholderia pseudomallei]OMU10877.1 hypothetical protein AQ769_22160 [Burkholderia pseudomallei]OMU23295.1 hypothetical protein AQ770_04235 [Burkholderia pseudomallei]
MKWEKCIFSDKQYIVTNLRTFDCVTATILLDYILNNQHVRQSFARDHERRMGCIDNLMRRQKTLFYISQQIGLSFSMQRQPWLVKQNYCVSRSLLKLLKLREK